MNSDDKKLKKHSISGTFDIAMELQELEKTLEETRETTCQLFPEEVEGQPPAKSCKFLGGLVKELKVQNEILSSLLTNVILSKCK